MIRRWASLILVPNSSTWLSLRAAGLCPCFSPDSLNTPLTPTHFMFEQAFKNIDDVLRKEAGCTTELDYTEQTSWLLFLKYLDGLEQDRAEEAPR